MCIKMIYHNTYGDGLKDVTERVESCTPGYLCPNPRIVEYDRSYKLPRREVKLTKTLGDRPLPASPNLFPPTPRSGSPSSPEFGSRTSHGTTGDADRRRPDIFVNGTKVSSSSLAGSRASPRVSVYTAPEPPSFNIRPIPIKRSSTLPRGLETPPPERGRWPIVVEDRMPRGVTSANASPSVPVDVMEHASSSRLRQRQSQHARHSDDDLHRSSSRQSRHKDAQDDTFLSPHRHRTSRSPPGYGSAEDEHDRDERRRRRRAARERASVTPSSLPAFGNTNVYGTSYDLGSSTASSYGSASAANSPAVAAVKKELRWEDEQRQKQNAHISMRPKLSRSQSVKGSTNKKLQGEVKSILKNGSGPSAPTTPVEGRSPAASPQTSPRGRRASVSASADRRSSDIDDVFGSFAGLGIHGRGASPADRTSEDAADQEYRDRLRDRFSMPPRRFTAGGSFKRRTEVWYPDEGRYRFM